MGDTGKDGVDDDWGGVVGGHFGGGEAREGEEGAGLERRKTIWGGGKPRGGGEDRETYKWVKAQEGKEVSPPE